MPVWIAVNDGPWNGDSDAVPSTQVGVGGQSLNGMRNDVMYPIAIAAQSTQTFNFGASAFTYDVPDGFTAGWPAVSGGFTSFDPSTVEEGNLSNGNLTFSGGSQYGGAVGLDGYTSGSYYFEMTNVNNDFFTTGVGTGISRSFAGGLSYNAMQGGEYNTDDTHGGVVLVGGSLSSSPAFNGAAWNQGNQYWPSTGALDNGTIVRVAATLEPTGFGNNFGMTNLGLLQPIPTDGNHGVTFSLSYDAGKTFPIQQSTTLGRTGAYDTTVTLYRWGIGRYGVWQIMTSAMRQVAISSLTVDFTVSSS